MRGTPRLPAEARLRLYSRDYHLRLLDCLRASHPALRELLGAELFEAFALDYVQARPSRSYTLGQLGAGFVEHLERTRPTGEEWALLVCELVRLERAVAEVYDGPGVEGERILTAEELPAEPAPWQLRASVGAGPLPAAGAHTLPRRPLPANRSRRRTPGDATRPGRAPWHSAAAGAGVVTVTDLDADRYAALEALVAGATVGELRELVAGSTVGELKALVTRGAVGELDAPMAGSAVGEGGESRIWEWLREWAAAGFLRRFDPGERPGCARPAADHDGRAAERTPLPGRPARGLDDIRCTCTPATRSRRAATRSGVLGCRRCARSGA